MERLVYGTRISGVWCFVVNSTRMLERCAGETTTMDAECTCGQNAMRLEQSPYSRDWQMVCTTCDEHYAIAQMPARQCAQGPWAEFPAEMAG